MIWKGEKTFEEVKGMIGKTKSIDYKDELEYI